MTSGCPGQIKGREEPQIQAPHVLELDVCPASVVHQRPTPSKEVAKVPQGQVLKVGMPGVGFKPFAPQGEAGSFEFSPDCGSLHWGWGLR